MNTKIFECNDRDGFCSFLSVPLAVELIVKLVPQICPLNVLSLDDGDIDGTKMRPSFSMEYGKGINRIRSDSSTVLDEEFRKITSREFAPSGCSQVKGRAAGKLLLVGSLPFAIVAWPKRTQHQASSFNERWRAWALRFPRFHAFCI